MLLEGIEDTDSYSVYIGIPFCPSICLYCSFSSYSLKQYEAYVKEKGLAGITLSTNKYAPAPLFYRKNGFVDCEHVLFMAKEITLHIILLQLQKYL